MIPGLQIDESRVYFERERPGRRESLENKKGICKLSSIFLVYSSIFLMIVIQDVYSSS